ncbi:hypothetical protein Esi_0260_0041 [Ectocarpus siliculosus]|uniref:Uncharacterized protein n=1 Tax=Ectocarpus siliculosus TaxID=2880 RepID=D7FTX0_ECTSI|nr:hypothetical protein Esi_0260_0041 [Ectocarpus siliculosus]|eukprot:CBJ31497.1 hypothetical protein Esi_0260_0041 [Ectocarpus siliculosus]
MNKSQAGFFFDLPYLQDLWQLVNDVVDYKRSDAADNLPVIVKDEAAEFPYELSLMKNVGASAKGSSVALARTRGAMSTVECFLCGIDTVTVADMRAHVAQRHLLQTPLRITDWDMRQDRCGFCGLAGTCPVSLVGKGNKNEAKKISTQCRYVPRKEGATLTNDVQLRLSSAAKFYATNPVHERAHGLLGLSLAKPDGSRVEVLHAGARDARARWPRQPRNSPSQGVRSIVSVERRRG